MTKEIIEKILQKYLPEAAVSTLAYWIFENKVHLRITHRRSSRFGDYTPPHERNGHVISVNGDLNPFAFLITLVHELAHLNTWHRYRNRVDAHGAEWKDEFRYLLSFFTGKNLFPAEVESAILRHFQKVRSSTCYDVELMKALSKYNANSNSVYIDELKEDEIFEAGNGKKFRMVKKIRKRYQCIDMQTNRVYLFSPVAEVRKVV